MMIDTPSSSLVRRLFDGPIDIVGDVHGEIGALNTLLARLGYPDQGKHPEGRRLVYVGDLIDRGPDSPSVVERVMSQIDQGIAQCILGNHEINILRTTPNHPVMKHGNHWFWDQRERIAPEQPFFGSIGATSTQRARFKSFFQDLPLALEREDLRVVHACWDPNALRASQESSSALELFQQADERTRKEAESSGLRVRSQQQLAPFKAMLRDPREHMPFLEDVARYHTALQVGNPVKVLSSGPEEPLATGETTYHVGGKWRMTVRVPWWERYQEQKPVIFGHYWRRPDPKVGGADRQNVLGDLGPEAWMGPRKNCYCVDLSVGRRYLERTSGKTDGPSIGTLAALRVPEWQLVMDDRPTLQLQPPGSA